jgi:hypothetical protein
MTKCPSYAILLCCILISAVHTQSQTDAASREQSLKEFLENTLGISRSAVERSVKYLSAFVDLDGDGVEEAIIYVTDQDWCGMAAALLWY